MTECIEEYGMEALNKHTETSQFLHKISNLHSAHTLGSQLIKHTATNREIKALNECGVQDETVNTYNSLVP